MLSALSAFVASPLFLELSRQFLRWVGVGLMTVGVPESIAGFTTHEEVIIWFVGAASYAVAETGWLVSLRNRFNKWRARR